MTDKDKRVLNAMQAVMDAETHLFNALYDNYKVDQSIEALDRYRAMRSAFVEYRHTLKQLAA